VAWWPSRRPSTPPWSAGWLRVGGWSAIDATVRAILRAGAYELAHRPDVPTEVAIDEYVEVAKSFFEGPSRAS
jgi:transcription termination factor NusB